jgi:hypothetical protein
VDFEPEDESNKLQEALGHLADLISGGIKPNKAALDEIIQQVGLNGKHDWSRDILERACPILERAHNDLRRTEKDLIITELEALGMKKFPAILTYDKAKPKPLSVEPKLIDFGCLKLGKEGNATLKVTGGSVKEVLSDKRIKVNLIKAGDGSTLIKVVLLGGSAGELFKDDIVIKGDKGELRVEIYAQWEKQDEKEPPFRSRCPICDPKVHRKTLFYAKVQRRYRCSQCEREFPYPDKRISEYNNTHP